MPNACCANRKEGYFASVLSKPGNFSSSKFVAVVKHADVAVEMRAARMRSSRIVSLLGHLASRGGDLAPLLYLFIWFRRDKRAAVRSMILVCSQALVVNYLVKPFFKRDRPSIGGKTSSFPSGHAASAVASAALAPSGRWWAGGFAVATMLGRIIRGAHWLSDVLAGSAVGLSTALLYRKIPRKPAAR